MGRHEPVPTSGKRRKATEVTQPLAGTEPEDLARSPEGVRREAVAQALQEWIVPLLVRRFLDEHAPSRSELSQADLGRTGR